MIKKNRSVRLHEKPGAKKSIFRGTNRTPAASPGTGGIFCGTDDFSEHFTSRLL